MIRTSTTTTTTPASALHTAPHKAMTSQETSRTIVASPHSPPNGGERLSSPSSPPLSPSSPSSPSSNLSPLIYSSLSILVKNGIQVDKHLRQPSYYTWVGADDLSNECLNIIGELLTGQRVPIWLAQRVAWFYSSRFMHKIVAHLNETGNDSAQNELKRK